MRSSATDEAVLVIGYGNSLRRDDGAGLFLAEKIAAFRQQEGRAVTLLTSHQLEPEMAEEIAEAGAGIVLFVDTVATTADGPHKISLSPVVADEHSPSLGHHFSPALLMLYARSLYGYEGAAWLLTIPGYDFDHGEGLSESTQRLLAAFSPTDLPF
jgi:hydrogenase maturation protease